PAPPSARGPRGRPCPAPIPVHSWRATSSLICAPSHSPATTRTPPKRRTVASSRRRTWAEGRSGGRSSTSSQPSSSEATTCGHLLPGSATSSIRSGSRPASTPPTPPPRARPRGPARRGPGARAQAGRPPAPPRAAGAGGRAPARKQLPQGRKHRQDALTRQRVAIPVPHRAVAQRPARRRGVPQRELRNLRNIRPHRNTIEQRFDTVKQNSRTYDSVFSRAGRPAGGASRRGAAAPGLRSEELATSDEGRRRLKARPAGEQGAQSRRGAAAPGLRSEELATSDEGRRRLKARPAGEQGAQSRRGAEKGQGEAGGAPRRRAGAQRTTGTD